MDKKLVYFAHPLTHYGTKFEQSCEQTIVGEFKLMGKDIIVFNPNQVWLDRLYTARKRDKVDDAFAIFEEITSVCDITVGATFHDGMLGAGVFKELKKSVQCGCPTYLLYGKEKTLMPFDLDVHKRMALTIEETRERIKEKVL